MRKKLFLLVSVLGVAAHTLSMELAPLSIQEKDSCSIKRSRFVLSLRLSQDSTANSLPRDGAHNSPSQGLEEDIKSPKSLGMRLVITCRTAHLSEVGLRGTTGTLILDGYIKRGADLDACDKQGSSLMWLAFFGFDALFKHLLDAGASIVAASDLGYTALHAAAQEGHLHIVQYILSNQLLGVNIQATCGSTPLHLAVQGRKHVVVACLLAQGASVDITDSLGRTALHIAICRLVYDI
jgi:hypothetical protein